MRFHSAICGVVAAALAGVVAAACSSDGSSSDEPTCLPQAATTDCTPTYEPTFHNVWETTLKPICAANGCHSGSMPTGNMSLEDEAQAYTNLLMKSSNGEPRVTAGDVKCGKVVVRLNSKNEAYSMPPTMSLPANDLCSIMQWIAMGAKQ